MVGDGVNYAWWPVTSGVAWGSVLGIVLSSVFIQITDNRIRGTLTFSKLAGDTRLSGRVDLQTEWGLFMA